MPISRPKHSPRLVLVAPLLMTAAIALAPLSAQGQSAAGNAPQQAGQAAAPAVDPVAGRYAVISRTNVRAEPSAQSPRVGQAEMGSTLQVLGVAAAPGWYRVRLDNGLTGHIISTQLRPLFIVPPVAAEQPAPASAPEPVPPVQAAPVAPVESAPVETPAAAEAAVEAAAEPAAAPAPAAAETVAAPAVAELERRLGSLEAMLGELRSQIPEMEELRARNEALAREVAALSISAAVATTAATSETAGPAPAQPAPAEAAAAETASVQAVVQPLLDQLKQAQADIASELKAQREELDRAKPLLQELDGMAQSLRGWVQQTREGVAALSDQALAQDGELNPLTMLERLNRLQEQVTTGMTAQQGEFEQMAEKLRSLESSVKPLVDWARRLSERAGPAASEAQGWFSSTFGGLYNWLSSFIYANPATEPLPVVTDSVTVRDLPASVKP